MTQLYSYDIFDTCLVRTCGEARNVFHILATDILDNHSDISTINDFALIRINAEKEAREKLIKESNEEITLEDIYSFCDFSSITTLSNKAIMAKELEIEKQVLLPVEKIKKEINTLVNQGALVIYISDMYLPLEFITEILHNTGFYVNNNVYLSSDIKKTKSSGHLYDYIYSIYNIRGSEWTHKGDNNIADHAVPKKKGIKAKLIKHSYNQYELIGKESLQHGMYLNSAYPFSLSRAIRLSMPDTPNHVFASTFIAPMFVSYVYQILSDAQSRGINHLFFLSRDGYILYNIAKVFSKQFPEISLSYLYVSRQSLYMVGLNEISAECIKKELSYLKRETISRILYDLHLPSYDYSHLPIKGLNGEQIIDILFKDNSFVDQLKKKHLEQNTNIIKYFKQEGFLEGHCATVDAVGSRRCQNAINNILYRNNYPEIFSYYFEVTWNRTTNYKPYLAMIYQETIIGSGLYNRASQPLYEQFFAISNHNRTIEYYNNNGYIEPVFEKDFISDEYKQKIYNINESVCISYAKHYIINNTYLPMIIIQGTQKALTSFCYAPNKELLAALESFRCTGSGEANEYLLSKQSLLYVITHIKQYFRWPEGQLIYCSGKLYPLIYAFLRFRHRNKLSKIFNQ